MTAGGARKAFDIEAAQALADIGRTPTQIADLMGVNRQSVWSAIREGRMTCTMERQHKRELDEGEWQRRQAPEPLPDLTGYPPRMATLIATGGRYADLAAWARDWGVTEVKARQEWHALRLPVRKGVAG